VQHKIINGKEISDKIRANMQAEVDALKEAGTTPGLVVVLVGEDPASQVYVRSKQRACEKLGMLSETIRLPDTTSQQELLELIDKLNHDERFHGILVQLPLPEQIREQDVLESVNPRKDVDCFHPENVGRLVSGDPYVLPCTPAGIVELLLHSGVETSGKHAVVLGRSNIVGKPIANMLVQKSKHANCTVTVAHSRTQDIPALTRQADILIAAIGKADFVDDAMVKEGVVVIDVGINRVPADNERGYRLVGDVDFDKVAPKASKITPVPGGVGPMTITMLLQNTLTAARYFAGKQK
jgi:methylenetetrahydrofolate dehydrogenase (NADP+)/methenyltetrahydrofolate cyclohydrolase